MKHLFIVNPVAGGKDNTELVRSNAAKVFGDDFEVYVTKGPRDAIDKVKACGMSGEQYQIFSCGGDGTFSECCNGAALFGNLAVAPYPIGTGNDFCRMFGKESALFKDLNALSKGRIHPIDLIKCNDVYCDNLCSVGIDARVGCNVHNYTHLFFCKGPLAYVVSMFVELTKGINSYMKIDCSNIHLEGKFALACICNGRYYGGGFMPSKDAMPDDGILDIYIVKETKFSHLAAYFIKYIKGNSDKVPNHIYHLKEQEIAFVFDKESLINIDGEAIFADKLDLKLVPNALNLIVPDGMTFFD